MKEAKIFKLPQNKNDIQIAKKVINNEINDIKNLMKSLEEIDNLLSNRCL